MIDREFLVNDLRSILIALRQGSPIVLGVSDSIRLRLLRRYFEASRRNVSLHIAALAVLLFGIAHAAPLAPRVVVFSGVATLLWLRRVLADRQLAALERKKFLPSPAHDASLLLTLTGWGTAPLLINAWAPASDFFALCLVAVIVIGLNTFTYLSALPANALFLTWSMGLLTFGLARHDTPDGWALAAGTMLAGLAGLLRLCVNHRVTLRMLKTERHNAALIAELQYMHDQLALENQALGASLKDVSEAAVRDPLTRVFNRQYLAAIAQPLARCVREQHEAITVCMVDVDHFKRVNDRWGHAFGDRTLKAVVARLNARLRDADRLARYGGEEFVVILRRCDVSRGSQVAEALRQNIADRSLDGPDGPVFITASVGVARWRADETLDAVLLRADRALYRAKHAGRNRVEVDRFDADDRYEEPSQPARITGF